MYISSPCSSLHHQRATHHSVPLQVMQAYDESDSDEDECDNEEDQDDSEEAKSPKDQDDNSEEEAKSPKSPT